MSARQLTALLILTLPMICAGTERLDDSVPDEVSRRLMQEDMWKRFDISERVNPFYLRADLDGDGKPDYVVLLVEKGSRQEYTALVMSGLPKIKMYPSKGRDFDGWTVVDARYLTPKIASMLRVSHREAFVVKFGGPGILEYWDGKELQSVNWGD